MTDPHTLQVAAVDGGGKRARLDSELAQFSSADAEAPEGVERLDRVHAGEDARATPAQLDPRREGEDRGLDAALWTSIQFAVQEGRARDSLDDRDTPRIPRSRAAFLKREHERRVRAGAGPRPRGLGD